MSMNLPEYVNDVKRANSDYADELSKASAVFVQSTEAAREKLDDRLRMAHAQFYEEQDKVKVA